MDRGLGICTRDSLAGAGMVSVRSIEGCVAYRLSGIACHSLPLAVVIRHR